MPLLWIRPGIRRKHVVNLAALSKFSSPNETESEIPLPSKNQGVCVVDLIGDKCFDEISNLSIFAVPSLEL
jgi:hypothetical protein